MAPREPIVYACEPALDVAEFRQVLVESGLGSTRPIDDDARLRAMLAAADLIVTARRPDRRLVGVARGVTDFVWVCYLSEVVVAKRWHGHGVGRALLDDVRRRLGPRVSVALASMPDAVGFYERIGMPRLHDAFCWRRAC